MQETQVISLYLDMESHGIELWLIGGWGIDALVGRQTREHHDLDVLVEVTSLERFRQRLHDLGFDFQSVWDDETWWIHDDCWTASDDQPTAFVYAHRDGREIDVHVIRREQDGTITTLWTSPHQVTAGGLEGNGVVGARPVRCLTAEMQREAHTGYELPPHQIADLQLLTEASDG
jgi:lincosamide nucleotidyltransferase A/C/D/E